MDDTIRYLRLDLNNEQLKTAESEEKNKQLAAKLKSYENTISYVKECIQFINADHTFTINVNIGNLSQYNSDIIESARKFFKIEREFKKIQEYPNVDESIKTNYDKLIQRTFDDIKKKYDKVNNTLKQIDKSVSAMKFVFYLLILVNILVLIYNSSEPLTRLLKAF
jgi:chromosome segregation ATPase